MKKLLKLRYLLLAAAVTLLMAVPAQAEGPMKQAPVYLTISGLTDGVAECGQWLTFKATGGSVDMLYLKVEVDGLDTATYFMPNGTLTLEVGSMVSAHGYLATGRNFTAYVVSKAMHNYAEERSASQSFSVRYPTSASYSLVSQGVDRLYVSTSEQYSLASVPVLYKDGVALTDPETQLPGSVFRYEITTETTGELVSTDGMVKDVGYYNVKAMLMFTDPDTNQTIVVTAEPVLSKIISPEIVVDGSKLDGGSFTFKEGSGQTIQPVVAGMPANLYTLTYTYQDENTSQTVTSTNPPVYTKEGSHPVQVTATFTTSRLITASANATITIGKKAADGKDSDKTASKTSDKTASKTSDKTSSKTDSKNDTSGDDSSKSDTTAATASLKKAKTEVTKLQNKKGQAVTLKFKSNAAGVKGYEVVYSTNKKFTKKTTKVQTVKKTKTSVTIKNLKKGKTYYFKVRPYKLDKAGKKVYGKDSAKQAIKITK